MKLEELLDPGVLNGQLRPILPPGAMFTLISRYPLTAQIRDLYLRGALGPEQVRSFVEGLMGSFERGRTFPFELELSVLAVALEPIDDDVCRDFVANLAMVQCAEMPLSPAVARATLEAKTTITQDRAFGKADGVPAYADEMDEVLFDDLSLMEEAA